MPSSNGSDGELNKQNLYGEWLRGEKWKRRLQKATAHKAMDIAEEEPVEVNVNKSTGISTAGLLGAVGLITIGNAILGAAFLFRQSAPAPQVVPPQTIPSPIAVPSGEIEMQWEWDGQKMTIKPKQ